MQLVLGSHVCMADGGGALGVLLHTHVSPRHGRGAAPLGQSKRLGEYCTSSASPEMGCALNIWVASVSWSPGEKADGITLGLNNRTA